jgi:phage shock protein A
MNQSAGRTTLSLLSAVRLRMRTVISVLDEMLDQQAAELNGPVPRVELTAEHQASAEAARREVEDSLRMLEDAAAEAWGRARDWQAKAELAQRAGRADLADQACERAAAAERGFLAYMREVSATQAFLQEWSVRVTDPRPISR